MTSAREPHCKIHLIERLPRRDRLRLLAVCESVPMVLTTVLADAGKPTRHVYFPTHGFISLVTQTDGVSGVAVGMVDREGVLGAQLALGVSTSPVHALVQGTGTALRVKSRAFTGPLALSPALQRSLNEYLYVLMAQLATSVACLRFHMIGARLARWYHHCSDRIATSWLDCVPPG